MPGQATSLQRLATIRAGHDVSEAHGSIIPQRRSQWPVSDPIAATIVGSRWYHSDSHGACDGGLIIRNRRWGHSDVTMISYHMTVTVTVTITIDTVATYECHGDCQVERYQLRKERSQSDCHLDNERQETVAVNWAGGNQRQQRIPEKICGPRYLGPQRATYLLPEH